MFFQTVPEHEKHQLSRAFVDVEWLCSSVQSSCLEHVGTHHIVDGWDIHQALSCLCMKYLYHFLIR